MIANRTRWHFRQFQANRDRVITLVRGYRISLGLKSKVVHRAQNPSTAGLRECHFPASRNFSRNQVRTNTKTLKNGRQSRPERGRKRIVPCWNDDRKE